MAWAQGDVLLDGLIKEALKNSPEIQASASRLEAAYLRVPQAGSLPDPMFMVGYQNEGFERYTYRREEGAQWMFSLSQQFYFPGKRGFKSEMALRDAQSLEAMHELIKLKTIARVKELYYDLFFAYQSIDVITEKRELFVRMEDLALNRYAAGKGMQAEVLMAQTEKYMLMERIEMLKQKILSLEAMLAAVLGRQDILIPRPNAPVFFPYVMDEDKAVELAVNNSPEIKSRKKMVDSAQAKHKMAKLEYFPDFALGASYFSRGDNFFNSSGTSPFMDMWSVTATINIPLYFYWKQKPAVKEAQAEIHQAEREMHSFKLMIIAAVRDNFSMLRSAEKLLDIYRQGLIPRSRQFLEQTMSSYATGSVDLVSVVSRVNSLLDYELLYWEKLVEREKAIARLLSITAAGAAKGENGE
ncbi:MAG TPA: TolC family protein [Smithellaceae bacterium]|nr:TolC family protein [Smithellaceae bacterium]HRS89373.1 TolC family protein [Smithellaceae bacterium]HRV26578.1 TolC family protein [Smithellaceae bacterium]